MSAVLISYWIQKTDAQTLKSKHKKQRQRNRPRNKRNRQEDSQPTTQETSVNVAASAMPGNAVDAVATEKTRDQIMAEREAKKLAKQAKKHKTAPTPTAATPAVLTTPAAPATKIITEVEQTTITTKLTTTTTTKVQDAVASKTTQPAAVNGKDVEAGEKTREQIKAEREAKKAAKKAGKGGGAKVEGITQQLADLKVAEKAPVAASAAPSTTEADQEKKPALSKAERRAIQEAQRAAKAQVQTKKAQPAAKTPPSAAPKEPKLRSVSPTKAATSSSPGKCPANTPNVDCRVKLFNHLVCAKEDSQFINDPLVHPSIARLGVQYAKRTVVGSNARCIAFLHALRQVVHDFETPAKKEFGRSLDAAVKHHVDHLHKCRPLAVSVSNAYKQFKNQLTQLPADVPETELKELLVHFIDTYMENQIGKAAQAISGFLQEKITDGDVLLTFACSSLIQFICEEAKRRQVAFRVIVVDSRPGCEGQELLRRLHATGIPCTYVLINAVGYVMAEATKVLLGAHALLANGYVMARTGTAQVALVANAHNVPVLVCCETHKFSERFQTDAIVYNELSDPNQLVRGDKCQLSNWAAKGKLLPLNLSYDITPPELVSAVVTEVAILPCTSVPVILRIKPDIGY
ncbi:translation initiation factor eIF-2B subunit delta isoform X2 [Drosophila sechellia]|uniref:translation initiation factor eIF-2B subunit delta isoform X2 n=1 Tax=Drosophila sechellia TaxID=7238 RepID=UPI0013DE26BF|nr:translation initiation factor eIF-2B subunit delta isoform X2 [Drosophila sechellia]